MPLALSVVSARLAAVNGELSFESPIAAASSKRHLEVLMGAMKSFLPQYDGVELVKETVKRAADLAQADTQSQPANTGPVITDWTHHLAKNPSLYMKMTMAIDMSISKGRIAEDNDFPAWLFSRMTLGRGDVPSGQPVPQPTPRSTRQSAGARQERNLVNTHLPIATWASSSYFTVEGDHERRATTPVDPVDTSWGKVCPPLENVFSECSAVGEHDSLRLPSFDDAMGPYFGADTSYMESIQDLMGWT